MSLAEDYGPCQNCGGLTDSGVCSASCADALDEQKRLAQREQWLDAGLCGNCGDRPCSTCGQCHDCDNIEDEHEGDGGEA